MSWHRLTKQLLPITTHLLFLEGFSTDWISLTHKKGASVPCVVRWWPKFKKSIITTGSAQGIADKRILKFDWLRKIDKNPKNENKETLLGWSKPKFSVYAHFNTTDPSHSLGWPSEISPKPARFTTAVSNCCGF